MLTKHLTDSCRKVISCIGDKLVVEPEGGPRAVFRRPLTTLKTSDGIIRVLIHFTKTRELSNIVDLPYLYMRERDSTPLMSSNLEM